MVMLRGVLALYCWLEKPRFLQYRVRETDYEHLGATLSKLKTEHAPLELFTACIQWFRHELLIMLATISHGKSLGRNQHVKRGYIDDRLPALCLPLPHNFYCNTIKPKLKTTSQLYKPLLNTSTSHLHIVFIPLIDPTWYPEYRPRTICLVS